jgi:hypothetical protein
LYLHRARTLTTALPQKPCGRKSSKNMAILDIDRLKIRDAQIAGDHLSFEIRETWGW